MFTRNNASLTVPTSLIHKLASILENFHLLAERHKLNDMMVTGLTTISLPIFFIEGVDMLKLSAISLTRTVCCSCSM